MLIFKIFFISTTLTGTLHQVTNETKEFQLIKERVENILKTKTYIFDYEND